MQDLHVHVWPHRPGTPTPTYDDLAGLCDAAARAGVEQIAVTEHAHRFVRIQREVVPHWRRDDDPGLLEAADHVLDEEGGGDLDAYVDALVAAKRRGLPLLVGLEVDYWDGAAPAMGALLHDYPFDVRLGSVHWLGAWLFDDTHTRTFAREWGDQGRGPERRTSRMPRASRASWTRSNPLPICSGSWASDAVVKATPAPTCKRPPDESGGRRRNTCVRHSCSVWGGQAAAGRD